MDIEDTIKKSKSLLSEEQIQILKEELIKNDFSNTLISFEG